MSSNDARSDSRPLSSWERQALYSAAQSNLFEYLPGMSKERETVKNPLYRAGTYDYGPEYIEQDSYAYDPEEGQFQAPEYQGFGDYDQLEENILSSRYAPIDRARDMAREDFNQSASDRGIWSSGLALEGEMDIDERFAPQYSAAGADAAVQRYGMEAQDLAQQNQYGLSAADMEYQSRWRPADYLSGIWNQTGGTISSGSSGGWSI